MPAEKREPRKKRYEVKNWKRYNEAKKNGRPFTYSEVAIETLLTIRELFGLPYRQTEGFGRASPSRTTRASRSGRPS